MANEHSQIVPSMQPTAKVADFKFWCQKVLPLVYDDSLSYYEVLNKMVVYLNQVIDNINADIDNVEELKDDFLLLQTYVNNFFDDIDQLVTYTERAEAAETAAATSAINAASSASNAATSASNSAGSASSAATSALSAMDAKDAAVAAKTAAEAALASAQTAATNAANSATAASGSATNAAASAASALQNFQLSDAARTAAQSAALSAESDAADAADSADEALAALDTISNSIGNIAKTIENEGIAHVDDALASIPKKLAVDIVPVQSGSGDPSPENVRPITGWTGANVVRTGKNLLPFPYSSPSGTYSGVTFTVNDDGTVLVSNTATSTAFFNFAAGNVNPFLLKAGSYIISGNVANLIICISEAATPIVIGATDINNGFFSVADDTLVTAYAKVLSGSSVSGTIKPILRLSSVADDTYEPYTGKTYEIEFPAAADIVYGATLTNDGTDEWKLRVTDANIASYNGETLPSTWISDRDVYAVGTTPTTGAQVVYKLADPIEYTITESQALTLLNGINNVWADTGNINTLEYFTNAENYVTSQIDLAKALIAPVLKEMKADTALVANDFRIVGNTLYRITGNIASGGTLTPNTNCVATTVGEILKSLLSA